MCLGIIIFASSQVFAVDDKGWHVEKSTHFVLYYKNADRDFLSRLLKEAEGYYSSIAEELGFTRYDSWLWDKRAKIYIYDSAEDYQAKTGKPPWSGGVAYYNEKIIETYPWAAEFFDTLLPHELSHIIFREFVSMKSSAPDWLDEGVAIYHEKVRRIEANKELRLAIEQGKFLSLDQLSTINIALVDDQELVRIYYIEAFGVVDYLIKEFGRYRFARFCRALKEGKNFDDAINSGYVIFKNLGDLNKSWMEYIKNDKSDKNKGAQP